MNFTAAVVCNILPLEDTCIMGIHAPATTKILYTPVYFISNRFISNQAQIPENLSNFYATTKAEIAWKLSNLMMKTFHKSQRVIIFSILIIIVLKTIPNKSRH